MTNNILKEIKNELISKGTEPRIDNLDQYISQNKIFTILFISKIMPDISSILSSIHAQYSKNSKLKLIICICTDTQEDFDETFSIINDAIPCLIFNYESKMRENLISKFNIITIPSLLILDKDGVLIDRLNTEKIQNLNENIIKGWENIFMIRNLFSQRRKLELGETIKLSVHHHELIYSNHSMKPGYGYSGWSCDICRRSYKHDVTNFFCPLCGWDLCDICYNKYKNS